MQNFIITGELKNKIGEIDGWREIRKGCLIRHPQKIVC